MRVVTLIKRLALPPSSSPISYKGDVKEPNGLFQKSKRHRPSYPSMGRHPFLLALRCRGMFRVEERLRLSDRNFYTDDVKSVWNPVRSADWLTE